jgi:predicted molibdopterin-dependent oxidoreductase YjgC
MFKRLDDAGATPVTVLVEGKAISVRAGDTAAAAAMAAGLGHTRTSPVDGSPRAPYCMIGACFECLLVIDGVPSRQGCLVEVREGMRIERQIGPRSLA